MAIAEACHNTILIDLYQSIVDYLESYIAERNLDSQLDFEKIDQLHENPCLFLLGRRMKFQRSAMLDCFSWLSTFPFGDHNRYNF